MSSRSAIKDNSARLLALKAGEVNAMENPNTDDVKVIQGDPGYKIAYRPAFNTGWFRFNMNTPPFQDKRVREAVTLAVNRRAIVKGLYVDGLVPQPSSMEYMETVELK